MAAVGNDGPAKVQALRGTGMKAIGLFNPIVKASFEMLYEYDEPFIVHAHDVEKRFGWKATAVATALAETSTGSRSSSRG